METTMIITKAINSTFSIEEKKDTDNRIIIEALNNLQKNLINIMDKYEKNFLETSQKRASIDVHIKSVAFSEDTRKKFLLDLQGKLDEVAES